MKPVYFDTQKVNNHHPRAILVGVETNQGTGPPVGDSLDELSGLATTAHYDPVAHLTQRLATIHPKTYLGSGKVEELAQAVKHHDAEIVIFDENLSPAQTRNLENLLKCNVVDRSWIILEIFSDHARTSEAKTQVELARLKYSLPRLTRMWGHLSRQRGGIGMRDVGETQIQLDRRMIRDQISKLTKKLNRIHKEKQTQRKSRQTAYQVALVGYTNVGKSTLMNCLTGADTLVENKLFATLDATVRKVKKNFPYPILLADTVGLIDKLPHDLVASFKSTLDEVRNADLLVHVIDISHPHYRRQMATAESVLNELGMHDTPTVNVFNKIDRIENQQDVEEMRRLYPDAVFVSCRKELGLDDLRQAIVRHYEARLVPYQVELDYTRSDLIPEIRKHALVVDERYHDQTMTLDLRIWPHHKARLMELLNGYA
ncbi:GTPase HflX [Nitrospina gracilis]|uniref:GTPase HflX n=1 Tax=Nitrospina gracilis TaxID=35801 RepID=UPI001F00B5D7|nr:GTPase HflX [Nitrospina gracilis]MCF8721692.1 GTP-binding protein HflX [Nitrospina gracilis Nb-211]